MKNINKKLFNNLSLLLVLSLIMSSCSDYLDINVDPDSPSDSQITEQVLLPGILTQLSYELAGGYPTRAASIWTQQIATSGTSRDISTLFLDDTDVNNTWQYTLYTGVLKDANNMINKAIANNNDQYIGIGKVIEAYGLSILADFWGQAPWSEAFNPDIAKPKYDSQESLYNSIDQLLSDADTALTNAINSGAIVNNDLLYNGDLTKWQKLAYSLRARYAMRLIYAKGTSQADLVISYAAKGFTSNDDDADFLFEDKEDGNNPWVQWADKWTNLYINDYLVSMLNLNSDPRIDAYALKSSSGTITGAENGTAIQANTTSFVSIEKNPGDLLGNSYFMKNTSGISLMTYSELQFLISEAYLFKTDIPNAQTNLENGIKENLNKIVSNGILTLSSTDIDNFASSFTVPSSFEDAQKNDY
jgi:hypothetical protein